MTIRVAIIGFGKIARDQHMPAIRTDPRFELVAVCTPSGDPQVGIRWFADTADLLDRMRGQLDAVVVCTPPGARYTVTRMALAAGLGVLLEKPPAATLGEVDDLVRTAHEHGLGLYAGWHAQHGAAIPAAAEALRGATIAGLCIRWSEDVRKWHPDQEWIWNTGGFGVFDPGINGLSIATKILPVPLFVSAARLLFPENRHAPIAATLTFAGEARGATMDWRACDDEVYDVRVETGEGSSVRLKSGGERLEINGKERAVSGLSGYASVYNRFSEVLEARSVDVDREPLRIVADSFMLAERISVDPV